MKLILYLSCTALLGMSSLCAFVPAPEKAPKVNVTVYVESMSMSVLGWYNMKVKPTLKALQGTDILYMDLIPFGNAQEKKAGKSYNYTCQFGKYDCIGTIADGCAKHFYPDDFYTVFSFFVCTAERITPQIPGWKQQMINCCENTGVDYNKIYPCLTGDLGIKLMHQNALLTGPHDYVPWILVDGKHSVKAYDKLLEVICDAYKGPKPVPCP